MMALFERGRRCLDYGSDGFYSMRSDAPLPFLLGFEAPAGGSAISRVVWLNQKTQKDKRDKMPA